MFENRLDQHLDKRKDRSSDLEAARRRQLFSIEIFRQADLQSVQAHQLRSIERSFLMLAREVLNIATEVEGMVPVIVWIWDNVKNKKSFIEGLEIIEVHLRSRATPHDIHDLLDLFQKAKLDPERFFREALSNLVALSKDDELFIKDPVQTLRQIHQTQDHLFLTNAFVNLLCSTAEEEKLIDTKHVRQLKNVMNHVANLERKLSLKEKLCSTG
jgi:hypothetical protein